MNNLIISLASVALGGVITWFVSRVYYKRAGHELKDEATELRRLNTLMLQSMEHAGWIKLNRDASGKILGFEQIIHPRSIESAERFGNTTIVLGPPPANQTSAKNP
jgi:hypothetical protein